MLGASHWAFGLAFSNLAVSTIEDHAVHRVSGGGAGGGTVIHRSQSTCDSFRLSFLGIWNLAEVEVVLSGKSPQHKGASLLK